MFGSAKYGNDDSGTAQRKRRLFVSQAPLGSGASADAIKCITQQAVLSCALRAGQESLRCSGPGWIPESDMHVLPGNGKPLMLKLAGFRSLEAQINPPAYLQACAAIHAQGLGPNPLAILENSTGALVHSFAGHFGICPLDAWRHWRLVESAAIGAYGSYYVTRQEEELATLVTLFFEQSLIAHAITEIDGRTFVDGIVWERLANQHPYHLMTALFDRTQSLLFPSAWERVLSSNTLVASPVADALLPDVIQILFGVHVRLIRGRLNLRGRPRRPDSWEWSLHVRRLAELLVPYLEKQRDERGPGGVPAPFLPQGDGLVPPGDGLAPPSLDQNGESHPFGGDRGYGPSARYADHRGHSGGPLPSSLGPHEPRFNDFEYIDRYYSERAKSLVIRDESEDKKVKVPERIIVGYLDHEPASVQDLITGQIDWVKTRVDTTQSDIAERIRLFRRAEPLEVPSGGDEPESMNMPNLLLIVDSSGSMGFNPAATEPSRGKYDVVLMAAWGMFAYIQSRRDLQDVRVGAVNFSSDTSASGWHACTELIPVKKVLAKFKGGSTVLNVPALQKEYETRPGKILTVVMTDGNLRNTADVLAELQRMVRDGNRLVLLHIGGANAFTQGVGSLKCPVHLLSKADDLVGLCLDVAKEQYRVK